jgi:hypothetical protein
MRDVACNAVVDKLFELISLARSCGKVFMLDEFFPTFTKKPIKLLVFNLLITKYDNWFPYDYVSN